eukprot:TRINITY_DN7825_c0_g1_i1.p1 TRINITY_DN7825_c0_g1~~TRINITY_DN7825_c0_g1_i1.p1  ORF type:complete len:543 (-),score=78.38 TRINITY_DN7825_c0_g1_i1:131-1714(-)
MMRMGVRLWKPCDSRILSFPLMNECRSLNLKSYFHHSPSHTMITPLHQIRTFITPQILPHLQGLHDDFKESLRLNDQTKVSSLVTKIEGLPNYQLVHFFSLLSQYYSQKNLSHKAIKLAQQFLQNGNVHDQVIWNTILAIFVRSGDVTKAEKAYERLIEIGLADQATYNSILSLYVDSEQYDKAIKTLAVIKKVFSEPGGVTYSILLKMAGHFTDINLADCLFITAVKRGVHVTPKMLTLLISCHTSYLIANTQKQSTPTTGSSHTSSASRLLQVFQWMSEREQREEIAPKFFSEPILALVRKGHFEEAVQVVRHLRNYGFDVPIFLIRFILFTSLEKLGYRKASGAEFNPDPSPSFVSSDPTPPSATTQPSHSSEGDLSSYLAAQVRLLLELPLNCTFPPFEYLPAPFSLSFSKDPLVECVCEMFVHIVRSKPQQTFEVPIVDVLPMFMDMGSSSMAYFDKVFHSLVQQPNFQVGSTTLDSVIDAFMATGHTVLADKYLDIRKRLNLSGQFVQGKSLLMILMRKKS